MTRSLKLELSIDAPVEDVFGAITDARELARWFPLEAGENDDGTLWMSWGDDMKFTGGVPETEPPNRVRIVHHRPPPGADPSQLEPDDFVAIATEYVLESAGGKTVLRLVESGFGDGSEWDEMYDATRSGWAYELRGLKHYLENHPGQDRVVAWARCAYEGGRADAWDRLMSPEGFGELEGAREGDRYDMRPEKGDALSGEVRVLEPPTSFVATVDNWNNGFLRIKLEDLPGMREAHVFLSTYGVTKDKVDALEKRWQARLDRLFTE